MCLATSSPGAIHLLNGLYEILHVADLLSAGIVKALLGKAAVPDDLPFVTGANRSSAMSSAGGACSKAVQ